MCENGVKIREKHTRTFAAAGDFPATLFHGPPMKPEQVFDEMTGDLEDAARWFSAGGLNEREFDALLDILGKRKLNGSGLRLGGFRAGDGGIHFTLRTASDAICVIMEFDPGTGKVSARSPCWGS
jgi:hypothetical protein